MKTRRTPNRRAARQAGQAFLLIIMMVSLFLLGALGLATDYAQVWAKRQTAQAAADAACQAGAGDIYVKYANPGLFTNSWIGTDYNCSTNTSSSPCVYAAANGYSGSNVSVTFPSTVSGVTSIPTGFGTIANPYIKVAVTDPVAMSFTKLVSSTSTVNISASAVCGLQPISVPIPLVVLHPTAAGALTKAGSGTITILGGPKRSVQVDSSDSGAVNVSGGANQIDLSLAGPTSTGSDFGVFGNESQPSQVNLGTTGKWLTPALPFGDPWVTVASPTAGSAGKTIPQPFGWDGCPDPAGCVEFTPGDYTGCSTSNSLVPGDIAGSTPGCIMLPYSGSNPQFRSGGTGIYTGWPGAGQPVTAKQRIIPTGGSAAAGTRNDCGCVFQAEGAGNTGSGTPTWGLTTPTNYQTPGAEIVDGGVTWRNIGPVIRSPGTAIFAPGIYYVGAGGFNLGSNSAVRISAAPDATTNAWRGDATVANGNGTNGVMFYFSTAATVAVTANSGVSSACTSVSWSGLAYSLSPSNCIVSYARDGGVSAAATGQVPSRALQCPGGTANPSQVPASIDGNILFGPCSGTYGSADSSVHGFLFFQSHSVVASPSWSGGGTFLLAGFMYFHNTSYGDTLTMQGGSGSTAYTLGNIVVDKLTLGGGGSISMILNPAATYQILHPSLLQ